VVCYGFAILYPEPSPSFSLLSFQAPDEVEEGDWRGGTFLWGVRQLSEDCAKRSDGDPRHWAINYQLGLTMDLALVTLMCEALFCRRLGMKQSQAPGQDYWGFPDYLQFPYRWIQKPSRHRSMLRKCCKLGRLGSDYQLRKQDGNSEV
jgi:hypothetical protein